MWPYAHSTTPLPLTTWGGFSGQRRLSDSSYIESIWEGQAHRDGIHLTAADGTIDLSFRTRQGRTQLLLSGPTSKARPSDFKAGDKYLTIRLRAGVHLSFTASNVMTDIDRFVPNAGKKSFWLHGSAINFPNFENTEAFIERLSRAGLVERDIIVEDILDKKMARTSLRTVQRHFLASTGLTMQHVRQIKRAEQARSLLSSGHTLTRIAYETGYSNPGHMTNSFKYFFGRTPKQLRALIG